MRIGAVTARGTYHQADEQFRVLYLNRRKALVEDALMAQGLSTPFFRRCVALSLAGCG